MMRFLFVFLLAILGFGCSKTSDFFFEVNSNPEFSVYLNGAKLSSFKDSIKIGQTLTFSYSVVDEQKLPVFLTDSVPGVKFVLDNSKFSLTGFSEGSFSTNLKVVDDFDVSAIFNLDFTVFSNIKPVCVIKGFVLENKTIEVNLSGSYDRDTRFGGTITRYAYDLDGYVFESNSNKVLHIFANSGYKRIRGRVLDNNEEWSNWAEIYLTVN